MGLHATTVRILQTNAAGLLALKAARQTRDFVHNITNFEMPNKQQTSRVTCFGKHLTILHRCSFADRSVLRQCFHDNQYDILCYAHGDHLQLIYNQIVASGRQPLIIDCGANIGASVLWFLSRYPKAHALAIEPAPDNFALLRHNCTGYDVDLREAGVAACAGEGHLSDPGQGAWAYRTDDETATGPTVPMVALNTLIADKIAAGYIPFILKIDIEGAEKDLFQGDCEQLNIFPLIVIEPHDWMLPGQGSSLSFFRFHTASGREFHMRGENVASIAVNHALLQLALHPESRAS
jgi:FkbM family methyltransferase